MHSKLVRLVDILVCTVYSGQNCAQYVGAACCYFVVYCVQWTELCTVSWSGLLIFWFVLCIADRTLHSKLERPVDILVCTVYSGQNCAQ